MLVRAIAMIAIALMFIAAPERGGTAAGAPAAGNAEAWFIGPVIRGRNYSEGVPIHPTPRRDGGWHIDIPRAPGSVHYVTFRHGSLAGKSRIVMRYRVETDPGVQLVAASDRKSGSMITPYFQRSGDNWSGNGRFEGYRWFATFATHAPITRGEHVIVAPLNGPWTAIDKSTARNNPAAFRAAIYNADQVGFVLGGGDGYGHGVFATGRARLIIKEFRVE